MARRCLFHLLLAILLLCGTPACGLACAGGPETETRAGEEGRHADAAGVPACHREAAEPGPDREGDRPEPCAGDCRACDEAAVVSASADAGSAKAPHAFASFGPHVSMARLTSPRRVRAHVPPGPLPAPPDLYALESLLL